MSRARGSLVERVEAFIERHRLLDAQERVIVGLSGGADSVALTRLLVDLGNETIAVHVNYGIRGAESEGDEHFVRAFCLENGIPLLVHRADLSTVSSGESVQMAARRIRYDQFVRAARTHNAPVVAVAHHADDQAETLLLNLFRGTGPEGLAAMPPRRGLADGVILVRPMLELRRHDIETWLGDLGISWRDDATNLDDAYRRGFIRHRLLPAIEGEFDGGVVERIARAASLMRGYVDASLRPELDMRFNRCAGSAPQTLALNPLQAEPEVWRTRLLLEALARWLPDAPRSDNLASRLERLLASQSGSRVEAGSGSVWREQDALRFIDHPGTDRDAPQVLAPGQPVQAVAGRLALDEVERGVALFDRDDPFTEYLDLDSLEPPIVVRRWEDGDRFRPLGLGGSRLVSDVLTDAGVPSSRRRNVLVVADAAGILWLVGHRLDERGRITAGTTRIARLSFNPEDR